MPGCCTPRCGSSPARHRPDPLLGARPAREGGSHGLHHPRGADALCGSPSRPSSTARSGRSRSRLREDLTGLDPDRDAALRRARSRSASGPPRRASTPATCPRRSAAGASRRWAPPCWSRTPRAAGCGSRRSTLGVPNPSGPTPLLLDAARAPAGRRTSHPLVRGREDDVLRAHRARGGQRRPGDPHQGPARRRRVGHRRDEALHHQRRRGRLRHRLRGDRRREARGRRHHRLRRAARPVPRRQDADDDRRRAPGRAVVRRGAGAGRPRHRRGRPRLPGRDDASSTPAGPASPRSRWGSPSSASTRPSRTPGPGRRSASRWPRTRGCRSRSPSARPRSRRCAG